jgi:NhaP-type Na+/H+ or K+/H+ antiporter
MGEQNISIFLVFFTGLLAFTLVLSKFLHDRPRLGAIVPEAAMVLAVGMLAGFLIHLVAGQVSKADDDGVADDDNVDGQDVDQDLSALLSFSPEIFFIALLPPIIFNSGLRIGALFFRHFVPILGFAVFGTSIAAISTALLLKMLVHFDWCGGFYPTLTELLTFGALISSTDPVSTLAVFQAKRVDPQLFYLVFGESVLNDALCIVLFNAFSKFVSRDNNAASIAIGTAQFFLDFFLDSVGSLCLGICSGLATAYLFKQIDMRENRLIEISLYLLLVYVPFLLAEIMQLSGIVTILFTGISANRYIVPNLSQTTKVNADMLFRLLAHLAETSIFLELGLSVFGLIGHWNWKFIGWSLLVCLVARALNIYPIAYCFNRLLLTGGRDYEDLFIEHEMKRFRKASRLGTTEGEMSERFSPSVQTEIDEGMIISSSMSMRSSTSESSTVTATPLKRKDLKVRGKTQHMMWFSGLRGAVAYACVRT